jgi:chromosome partitioning protein
LDAPSQPRVVSLLNQKGGVGKTTSSVNLGAAMAEAGRRVCLIDLDPQAHMTLHVGVDPAEPEHSVYDLLVEPEVPASATRMNVRPKLDLIPSEVDLAAAEVELAHHPQRQRILADKFAEIADDYDFVLIDCPPSLGLLTLNALLISGEVFVPMQAHFLALQGVGKLLETVGLVCRSVNPKLQVSGIILCMHEGQTTLAREVVADLEGFFEESRDQLVPWRNCRVLQPPIRRNVKLAEAPSFGQTIFDYAPWCPGAIDYRMLAARIMAAWEHVEPKVEIERPTPEIETVSQIETPTRLETDPVELAPGAGSSSATQPS